KEIFESSSPSGRLGGALELNTMPGWAGSSFYFNRYMDPHNSEEVFSQEAIDYWQDVDLYIGGSEHATGHLLYSRFWQKFLYDKGLVPKPEYAKKLINQGMITGTSAFLYRITIDYYQSTSGKLLKIKDLDPQFISYDYVLKGEEIFKIMENKKSSFTEDFFSAVLNGNSPYFTRLEMLYYELESGVENVGNENYNSLINLLSENQIRFINNFHNDIFVKIKNKF